MRQIKIGIYKHYKGGLVKVISVVNHSETLEKFVFYEALYECKTYGKGSLWIRPLKMFMEDIKIDNNVVHRFTFVE